MISFFCFVVLKATCSFSRANKSLGLMSHCLLSAVLVTLGPSHAVEA
jgi:hypothetical protein